jgi:ribosome-associated protein
LILNSQRFRDQDRNRQDCLEKLGEMIRQALVAPRPRKKTKPTHGARLARLRDKRHRATAKAARRKPGAED